MRNNKELLLASKQYAHEHRWLSWWHVYSTLGVFAALITVICLDVPLTLRVLSSIAAGLVVVRLFVINHDYQHGAILRNSRVAGWIMYACGVLTLSPPSIWNRSHDHHHKNNSKIFGASIGSYPIMTTQAYARASSRERMAYAMSRHPATIALGYVTMFLYGMCLRSLMADPRRHIDSALAIVVHFGLVMGLAMVAWDVMLLTVLVPLVIASAIGAYLFYAQHNFPGVKFRDRDEWNHVFAALHSSSYIRMNPIMHWFTGNIGYHHVHHLNARIPFYRLPEAMKGIEEMRSPQTTTLSPLGIARCLRLKLWDIERDRLVSFREAAVSAAAPTSTQQEMALRVVSEQGQDTENNLPRSLVFQRKQPTTVSVPPLRKVA